MGYRWVMRDAGNSGAVAALQELLGIPEALARALVLRGVDTFEAARQFFRPSLDALHDPLQMQDMPAAAKRVADAIAAGERVLIYGDYDVDGATAVALLTRFLRARGLDVSFFVPDRFVHGYGLHEDGILKAKQRGATLMIVVDCGILAIRQAEMARQQEIDLIICDHHTPGDTIPQAVAVLDPKRESCSYPFKELSACGVALKLAQAVLMRLGESPDDAYAYLDLVAMSTICDMVPLQGENRILVRKGLLRMRENPTRGIAALANVAGADLAHADTWMMGFQLGPRINAAGRMGDATRSVRLLLSESEQEAVALATELDEVNIERRTLGETIHAEAMRMAEIQIGAKRRHALVLHKPDWHQGVLGIVATRVVQRVQRPVVVLCTTDDGARGSARSIEGVNIHDALASCRKEMDFEFGGHDYAAGVTLAEDAIPAFRDRLDAAVKERMRPELMVPALDVDAELTLSDVQPRFWKVLRQFAPFGVQNAQPLFVARNLEVLRGSRTVGAGGNHLKLRVRQNGVTFDVIAFGHGDKLSMVRSAEESRNAIEMVFAVKENTFRGNTSLQLQARDLRAA